MKFWKYQGTGNDFVMIDDRDEGFDANDHALVKHLCNRRYGIGADGLILLRKSEHHDFRMVYFNADGHEGSMCGNGGRCIVQFAHDLNIIGTKTTFIAVDGEHEAFIQDGLVHLHMIDVSDIEKMGEDHFLDTGSPHYVRYVDNLSRLDIIKEGHAIRYNDRFSHHGTNVNFVQRLENNQISIRTYERGVEDETLSCGTGATACALSASTLGMQSPVSVVVKGGKLAISFEKTATGFTNIYLIGPAQQVFQGNLS